MQVTLIALGSGAEETITAQARAALRAAACILGAPRLIEGLGSEYPARRIAATRPEELVSLLLAEGAPCAVVYSGDTGFYSGARQLLLRLREKGIDVRVLPGLSSVQLLGFVAEPPCSRMAPAVAPTLPVISPPLNSALTY